MLSSLARYLEPLPDEEGDTFLTQIQTLFQSEFIAKQIVTDQMKNESVNFSSPAVNSERLPYANLTHTQNYDEAKSDSDQENTNKTNSTTVLHMGSVLSAEHDYLLWNPIYLIFQVD